MKYTLKFVYTMTWAMMGHCENVYFGRFNCSCELCDPWAYCFSFNTWNVSIIYALGFLKVFWSQSSHTCDTVFDPNQGDLPSKCMRLEVIPRRFLQTYFSLVANETLLKTAIFNSTFYAPPPPKGDIDLQKSFKNFECHENVIDIIYAYMYLLQMPSWHHRLYIILWRMFQRLRSGSQVWRLLHLKLLNGPLLVDLPLGWTQMWGWIKC